MVKSGLPHQSTTVNNNKPFFIRKGSSAFKHGGNFNQNLNICEGADYIIMNSSLMNLIITEDMRSDKLSKRIEKQITQIIKRHLLKESTLDDVFEDVRKEVVNTYSYHNPYMILLQMCEIYDKLFPYIQDEEERTRFYTFWIEMREKQREVHRRGTFIDQKGHIKNA